MFFKTVIAAFVSSFAISAMAWADTPDFSSNATETPASTNFATQPKKLRWIMDLGYMVGGEKLVDVHLYNDLFDTSSTQDIRAGQGFWFMGGVELPVNPNWAVQARLGYLFDSVEAKNASFSFDRYPVELLPLYTVNHIQFGLGLTYHLNPVFDPDLGLPKVSFKNAMGFVGEFNYAMSDRARLGLHITQIDYRVKSVADGGTVLKDKVSGNGVGVHVTGAF